ncbi:uncharacterized protein LOC107274882 [Cephus cinctus]|uniref:Uncharacterized protein LOC107274882 n=1 Tax=Cephus cinctus TaxID=211228 RepID=A0AAJ7CH48_CEPCN|nr:uncharacterized protein LOC107274882 [Cephus cinctus]
MIFFYLKALVLGLILLLGNVGGNHRTKRVITFPRGSTMFYRVTYKLNMVPYSTLFAQASGFKVAWKLPVDSSIRISRSARDLHDMAEFMYERHGFDGRICVLKNICQAMERIRGHDGVIVKILKLIIGSDGNSTSTVDSLECDNYIDYCPLELNSVQGLGEF